MNILMTYKAYPLSMGRYFRFAFEKMGHKVFLAAPFYETIPWNTNRDYREYWDIPDLQLDDTPSGYESAHFVVNMARIRGFEPDIIVSADAGFALTDTNMTGLPNALILTDPHALPDRYKESVEHYDKIFCMQDYLRVDYRYKRDGTGRDVWWIPYAVDFDRHYWMGTDFTNRQSDVCIMSALLYPERLEALAAMESNGVNISQDSGLLYDEMSAAYNKAIIGFNRSGYGKQDLPARFWEALGMRVLCLTNRNLPDLQELPDLVEGVHYEAYDDIPEMLDKIKFYTSHRDAAWKIASAGFAQVWMSGHSYLHRASLILDVCEVKK